MCLNSTYTFHCSNICLVLRNIYICPFLNFSMRYHSMFRHHSRVFYSSIFAVGVFIVSFIYPIVPCKKMPNVPNPVSSEFTMCTLSYDFSYQLDSLVYYFGLVSDLIIAYVTVFVVAFLACFLVIYFLTPHHFHPFKRLHMPHLFHHPHHKRHHH